MTHAVINRLTGRIAITGVPDLGEFLSTEYQLVDLPQGYDATSVSHMYIQGTGWALRDTNNESRSGEQIERVSVNFGQGDTTVSVLVPAAWAKGSHRFSVSLAPSTDRVLEGLVLGLTGCVTSISAGVGFTLTVHAPNRASGIFIFDCKGY